MKHSKPLVCPVELAGMLDSGLRKLFQEPYKILKRYVRPGMIALDIGCGPGYFTVDMARLAGPAGKVIAADLQPGMLEKVLHKLEKAGVSHIVDLHTCHKDRIGVHTKADFILVFYMLHELPDQTKFIQELKTMLKPTGQILLVEPKFHVSEKAFTDSLDMIRNLGFEVVERPNIFFSRAVVLKQTF